MDLESADLEDKMKVLQESVTQKLTTGYGYELQDQTLSEWIVKLVVKENNPKPKVCEDLKEYIDDNNVTFTDWLWLETAKIWPTEAPKPVEKPVKAPEKPKIKNKGGSEKQNMKGTGEIFKKAIDGVKKKATKKEQSSNKGPKSFVKTGEDGRKIIMRPKSKGVERGYKQDRARPKEKTLKSAADKTGNIRAKKGKWPFSTTNLALDNKLLDQSLDSIIKKQKAQKHEEEEEQEYEDYQGYEQYPSMSYTSRGYSRGRGGYRGRGRRGGFKPHTTEDHNGDDDAEEKPEGEGQDGEVQESHKPKRGGYKGKNYNPYYDPNFHAYGGFNYMYPYPMMPAQSYYQPGYKKHKPNNRWKNMTWSKDMDEKKEGEENTKKRDVKALEKAKGAE